MLTNLQIADIFEEMADILEFQGENPFRVRAYRNGSRAIRDLGESIAAIAVSDPARLVEFDDIGKTIAEKTVTLVETGELPQLIKLRKEVPATVLAMMRIQGLGPKKAAVIFKELGVATLEELKTACEEGKIQALKGFGKKTEQMILDGIPLAAEAETRILWHDADQTAQALREHLETCPSIEKLELAGSYRRRKETIGDLDVLVVSSDVKQVMDRLGEFPGVATVLARGETKMSIRLDTKLQIDLRVVPARSFGAALQYFTGSKEHNVELRGRAKQQGLKINEYGVFRVEDGEETYLGGQTEKEVYDLLELPVFPPELRENRREYEWAAQGKLPELVELDDIRGDLHMHTTETDGSATLEEMVAAARERGLKYIAITDHSQRVSMARGLDPVRLRAQWKQIDALRETLPKSFTLLKGIECDILEKGGMDLPDDVLAEADWVLASIHYGQKQSRQQITERLLEAIENPHVTCIAHPTGRLLNQRPPYEVDLDAVLLAAQKHHTLLELNANPRRLDLNDTYCAAAKAHGIPIVVNTDAHAVEHFDFMRCGVLQARRGGLTKADVANTHTWLQMKKMMKK
ncbi:DNA polymerase/3'-5' exonuclease PolX [Lignipirellula cremea]|uniref:DNA polymerase beta n=1 Tax=Lignipirellula cremea TaxID=2528010 RepID=A0A518DMC3_9BACT|nr:DNA polymerase/3'-5' exonuclease PolX [Lignipirellula cremea]QDU92989.1 DNA polymerase/3'-5' exonuclease PolX [Lignipirellula cremea]